MFVLFFLFTLGYAYVSYLGGEGHFAARLLLSRQAFCLAESALDEAALEIRTGMNQPGNRWNALLCSGDAAALDGASLTLVPDETQRLLAERAGRANGGECVVKATFGRVRELTPRSARPGEKAGQVTLEASVAYGGATARLTAVRDFKVACIGPPPPFGDLSAPLVSDFFRGPRDRSRGGVAVRGLAVTTAAPPREGEPLNASGPGALYFAGNERVIPVDAAPGLYVATLAAPLSDWRRSP